jgi:hypothetical protein
VTIHLEWIIWNVVYFLKRKLKNYGIFGVAHSINYRLTNTITRKEEGNSFGEVSLTPQTTEA